MRCSRRTRIAPKSVYESWQRFFAGRGANGRSAAAPDGATPVTSRADGPASEKAVPPARPPKRQRRRPPSTAEGSRRIARARRRTQARLDRHPPAKNGTRGASPTPSCRKRPPSARRGRVRRLPLPRPTRSTPEATVRVLEGRSRPGAGAPGSGMGLSANRPSLVVRKEQATEPTRVQLKGAPMLHRRNMDASLSMPTATSGPQHSDEAGHRPAPDGERDPGSQHRRQDLVHPPDRLRA